MRRVLATLNYSVCVGLVQSTTMLIGPLLDEIYLCKRMVKLLKLIFTEIWVSDLSMLLIYNPSMHFVISCFRIGGKTCFDSY